MVRAVERQAKSSHVFDRFTSHKMKRWMDFWNTKREREGEERKRESVCARDQEDKIIMLRRVTQRWFSENNNRVSATLSGPKEIKEGEGVEEISCR